MSDSVNFENSTSAIENTLILRKQCSKCGRVSYIR